MLRTRPGRALSRLANLSAPVLALVGVLVAAAVGAGGYYAFRTYDYVQHDNDFCMSCHLMQEPFQQFAESAHRGLGCKACHQPTFTARGQMALTQIIENPEAISVHAEVPNERCAECHVEGDPERWLRTANTVGHRIHLESGDPVLEGLQCVECHSTSVHQFAPVDRTCGQSGCHDETRIQLGEMSDLTIHCVACHSFLAPAPEPDEGPLEPEVREAIIPDRETCLSCHVMRALVEMPDPDPHSGNCGYCHNPHEQDVPAEAAESCATAACHAPSRMTSPFHQGLRPGVIERCTMCHTAHDFSIDGSNCTLCHKDVDADSLVLPGTPGAVSMAAHGSTFTSTEPAATAVVRFATVDFGAYLHASPLPSARAPSPQEAVVVFEHGRHRGIPCTTCHSTSASHGEITVATLAECRSCHHTEPLTRSCARCHDESDRPQGSIAHAQTLTLSFGETARRALPFEHEVHEGLDCSTCHTGGLELSASGLDCASCHEEHHVEQNRCAACHSAPPTSAHPPAQAHATCSGSSCHRALPFTSLTWTRETCLTCHQTRRDHQAGRLCVDCHQIPEPRVGGPVGAP